MSKLLNKAVRLVNEGNNEKTWKEFAQNHPEVQVFYYKDVEQVIDVEPFFPSVKNFNILCANGLVQSIFYEYNGEIIRFPPE